MTAAQSEAIAPGVFTAHDVELIKRKFDRTCEELGLFPEDEDARRSLGHALIRAFESGAIKLEEVAEPAEGDAPMEHLFFEGEEMLVPASPRLRG